MKKAINFVAFQIGWFAAVMGPAQGKPWLGLVVVPCVVVLNLFLTGNWRGELLLALAALGMGFVFDTAMTMLGAFSPVPYLWPAPFSPPWMLMLWVNQAMTLSLCMGWLRERYLLGAVFGAIGGPLAYLGGARLGAAAIPSAYGMAVLALAWGLAFPALLWVAKKTTSG